MFDKLNYIRLSDKEYPIKCDMLVLERIQDEFGSLSDFENKLNGFVPAKDESGNYKRTEEGLLLGVYEMPDLKAVNQTLFLMVEEGLSIEAEEKDEPRRSLTKEQLLREVDLNPMELGKKLHEELLRCFVRKNGKSTQRKTAVRKTEQKSLEK